MSTVRETDHYRIDVRDASPRGPFRVLCWGYPKVLEDNSAGKYRYPYVFSNGNRHLVDQMVALVERYEGEPLTIEQWNEKFVEAGIFQEDTAVDLFKSLDMHDD